MSVVSGPGRPRGSATCPMCESPLKNDGACPVCGYGAATSRKLAMSEMPRIPASRSQEENEADGDTFDAWFRSRFGPNFWVNAAYVGSVILLGIVALLVVMHLRSQLALRRSHQRIDHVIELAARVRALSFRDRGMDTMAAWQTAGRELSAELPALPSYIARLDRQPENAAKEKKGWVTSLIPFLPADADLMPLEEVPRTSFAYEAIRRRLASSGPKE